MAAPSNSDASPGNSGVVRELDSGFDGLYLSGRCELPEAFVAKLDDARERAASEDVVVDLGGVEFAVSPGGLVGGYRYRLTHPAGTLGFTVSENRPAIRLQTRAAALHSMGPQATVAFFDQLLAAELGKVPLSPSRVDLCADWQGFTTSVDRRHEFVGQAKAWAGHEDGRAFNGSSFGRRKTKTYLARIYDKTAEIGGQDSYWPDVWGPRFNPDEPVIRVEFEIGRKGLTQLGLVDLDALWSGAGAAWGYLTESWLTHRTPNGDPNRSRWPISEAWRVIQQPSMRQGAVPTQRVIEAQRAASLAHAVPQFAGYLSTIAALEGTDDLHTALGIAASHVLDYHERKGTTFGEHVESKLHQWRLR